MRQKSSGKRLKRGNQGVLHDLVEDKVEKLKIDSVVRVLQNSYPFPDNFLALLKTK